MSRSNKIKNVLLLQLICIILPILTQAQITGINSVFPLQNALHTANDVIIGVQFSSPIDISTLNDSTFIVMGEQSGMHFGTIRASLDSMYCEFAPDNPFFTGELVTVTLTRGIRESSGTAFSGFIWNFLVAVTNRTNARFTDPDTIPLGDVALTAIMGDYNGDGFVDIAIQGLAHQFFAILLNDGSGNFNLHELFTIRADPLDWLYMMGNGDIDSDGDIDFIITNFDDTTTTLLWNDGNGFIEDSTVIHGFHNRGRLFDVNGDGSLDMVGAGDDGETFTVRINFGNGSYPDNLILKSMENKMNNVVFSNSDFDNDGDFDLTITEDNMLLNIGLNGGTGMFSKKVIDSSYGVCGSGDCFVTLDFNGDNSIDIALVSLSDTLRIYDNLDSTFILTSSTELRGDRSGKILGKDLDGDGDIDLITSGTRGFGAMPSKVRTNVQIWLNDGDGNFTLDQTYTWEDFFSRGYTISLADIENDGDLDLLIFSDWEMWILRNETIISVKDENSGNLPTGYVLSQNYPNPFNSTTVIDYEIPEASFVTVHIYNLRGQLVSSVVSGFKAPGDYKATWDGKDRKGKELSSGLYFYLMQAAEFKETRKMLLIR